MKKLLLFTFLIANLSITVAQNIPSYVPTNGLVGWWPFNGNANDESGNGNNGTVNGATLTTDRNGNANSAYSFDGVNDWVQIQDDSTLDLIGNLSLSCWFKATSFDIVSMILSKHSPLCANNEGTYVYGIWDDGLSGNHKINFSAPPNFSNATYPSSAGIVSTNIWYQFTITYDDIAKVLNYYLNGVLVDSKNISFDILNNPYDLFIGMQDCGSQWYFNGILDDIAIYNRTLSQTEITALYEANEGPVNLTATKTTVCPQTSTTLTVNSNLTDCSLNSSNLTGTLTNGLVGYWPFNGNANDESGNGNNGTVYGASLTTDRFGNVGKAYSFDGVNDNIIVPNNVNFQQNRHAINFWLKTNQLPSLRYNLITKDGPLRQWVAQLENNGAIRNAVFTDNGEFTFNSNINYQLNSWIMVTKIWDENISKTYINGSLAGSMNTTANIVQSNNDLYFAGNDSYILYKGILDDIAIFNRALTATEIQQLFNFSNPSPQASILWSTGDTTQTISVTPTQTSTYYCTVTCNGTSYTDSITINLDATAVAGSISGSGLCTPNTGTTLTLNNSTGTIKWQKSTNYTATTPTWTTITGATATTYATGALTASTAYRAILTSATCGDTTDKYVVVVSPKPVAGTAALNGTTSALVCSGGSKSLKLTGSTGSIQWQTASTSAGPWTDIEGATTATYTFQNLSATGLYRAKVSSGACTTVYSNAITLTVKQPTSAGTITASSTAVCSGSVATLTLSGSSGTILWQKSTNYSATTPTWATATGTSATLSTGALTASTAYRAVLSNSPCPSSTATMVTVTVSPKAVAGVSAVNNTSGLTVCKGGDKPVKLTGFAGSLQWQASTTSATTGFTDVSGATTQPYTFTNIQNNTWYRAKLSSGVCPTVYSNVLAITAKTPTSAGTITTTSGNVCSGTTGKTLTLSGSSGTIAWQKSTNWTATTPTWAVATGTTTTFTTGALTASTAYRAVLTNAPCPSSTADYIVVNVDPKVVVKTITANVTSPTGATATTAICSNTEKVLTLGAGYVGSIQWQKGITATGPWTDITGETSATYTVSNPSIGANYFRVKLSSGVCAVGYTTAVPVYYKTCAAIPTYVPTNGLIGWWPFNGNAIDESGNGNHGTVNGATLTTDRNGNANKAYSFDGVNDWIQVPSNSLYDNLSEITISSWINITSWCTPNVNGVEFFPILVQYASPQLQYGNFGIQLTKANLNYFYLNSNNYDFNQSSQNYWQNSQWVNLTVTASNGIGKWFINGNNVSSVSNINFGSFLSGLPILIGRQSPATASLFTNGKLDDIAIWNRALTQSEITALYTGITTSGMAQLQSNSLSEKAESLNNTILYNSDAVQQKSNEQIETTPFDAITFPNPYENYFHVQLNTSSDEQVAIKVYDMLGKVVEEHKVQPSEIEALQLGKDLSNGEYSIVIMQAGDVVRKRLVRQAH